MQAFCMCSCVHAGCNLGSWLCMLSFAVEYSVCAAEAGKACSCICPSSSRTPCDSLTGSQTDRGCTLQVTSQLPDLCVLFHESVQSLSDKFLAKERRHVYVTPTSYLELIHSYKTLLSKKQNEVCSHLHRCSVSQHATAHTVLP